jgi:DNA-binding LacI/PurR family transcriptional regulator
MALGVLRALHELGVRVPQDVSVVGYDDMPDAGFAIPPLTTLRQDYEGIGRTAVNSLMNSLTATSRKENNKPILVPCPLIIRASTGPAVQLRKRKRRFVSGSTA